jgi:hypothetical protein
MGDILQPNYTIGVLALLTHCVVCWWRKLEKTTDLSQVLVNDFQPVFYSKHLDRVTILKHTILKVPQNSNIFNDVSKGVHNNPVVSPPSPS